jgi:hypothetical protein
MRHTLRLRHSGQRVNGLAENFCVLLNATPQLRHLYV